MIEGDPRGAVSFGLCPPHYREALSGRVPKPLRPSPGRCAVKGDARPPEPGRPYCREHLAFFRKLSGGKLQRAVEAQTRFPVRILPLDKVVPGRLSMRPDLTEADVAELARSISENGQVEPILVVPDGKGRYEIVFGHARWLACRSIEGKKTIRAQVAPAGTPFEQLAAIAWAENFDRRWVPPYAQSIWIARLQEEFGLSKPQVAQALRITVREVERHNRVLERTTLPVRRAYLGGRLSMKAALELAGLPPSTQRAMARAWSRLERIDQKNAVRRFRDARDRREFEAWLRSAKAAGRLVETRDGVRVTIPNRRSELFAFFKAFVRPRLHRKGGGI